MKKPLENAFEPSLVEPADTNPAYKEALLRSKTKQLNKLYELIIHADVVVDTSEGKDTTIARFAQHREALRKVIPLPDDEWLATVKYCLIATRADVKRIADASNEALTPEEIAAGVAAFQRPIQRHTPHENHSGETASGTSG